MTRLRLFDAAYAALMTDNPGDKTRQVSALACDWQAGQIDLAGAAAQVIGAPGRPPAPRLVPPRRLVRRQLGSVAGRAALVHAIVHIEFNAINLALDATYRFRGLPHAYYGDWLGVAADEARHFSLLRRRLNELGYDYGDFPAHNGLWEMAEETAGRFVARMALVPRVLEARGLDVTPAMIERLRRAGDEATCDCLRIILREEEAHVSIGTRWFHHGCRLEGVPPEPTFRALLQRFMTARMRGPFNTAARRRAGFSESELAWLEEQDARASP